MENLTPFGFVLLADGGSAVAAGLGGAALGMLAVLVGMVIQLRTRLAALSRVEGKLDTLLEHAGVKYDPFAAVSDEVVRLLKSNDKIGAIKAYREATGVGLKEAKEHIEELQRRGGDVN